MVQVSPAHRCDFRKLPGFEERYELREPLDHKPGDESFTRAMQHGRKMMERGFVGQHVGNHNGYAIVRFFKP